jgi:hypothetical protein
MRHTENACAFVKKIKAGICGESAISVCACKYRSNGEFSTHIRRDPSVPTRLGKLDSSASATSNPTPKLATMPGEISIWVKQPEDFLLT